MDINFNPSKDFLDLDFDFDRDILCMYIFMTAIEVGMQNTATTFTGDYVCTVFAEAV